MSLEIRWTEPAWLSLAEVLDYTQLMFGERQAKKMRKQVMDGVRRIARSPQMSAVEPYSKKVGVEMRGYLTTTFFPSPPRHLLGGLFCASFRKMQRFLCG